MKEIILAIIASGLLTKLIDMVLEWNRNRKSLMRDGMRCLLRNEFLRYYEDHKAEQAFESEDEYTNIENMYKAYIGLKGNSFVVKRWEEMSHWKIN